MKRYRIILIIFTIGFLFGSCENEPIKFDSSKTFVAFNTDKVTVNENNADGGSAPIMVAALKGSPAITVEYEISTAGISRPAIEGTDFTIDPGSSLDFPDGFGVEGIKILPIDNSVFTGDKSFVLKLKSNSKGYNTGAIDSLIVVIKDDEHPLKNWIGTYNVAAVSYGSPGAWDEAWTVTTNPVEGDITKLAISGISKAGSGPIIATLDVEAMTITIGPAQSLGDTYGYSDDVQLFVGTPDLTIPDKSVPLTGTIQNDGTINIDMVGVMLVGGANDGYIWDVFNTTWTKAKKNGVTPVSQNQLSRPGLSK
jgi:hypothetical protein